MALKLGQTVETSTQQQGLVRYIGTINVAEGIWLGIELPSPEGKNDGSIRGERYFTCPPMHGLFIRELNVSRVVSQPAPKTTATKTPAAAATATTSVAKPKAPAPSAKPRPSSVAAAKSAPRPSSIINKRQSVAPTITRTAPARAPVRKASIASSSIASASESAAARSAGRSSIAPSTTTPSTTSSSTLRSSRDNSNVETLHTRIRHLEKQVADEQERNRELSQARDERDRFHGIIQKLQTKYQTLHSENTDAKAIVQNLQTENNALKAAQEAHDQELELAVVDKETAEEEKDQTESELEIVRSKLDSRNLDVEILEERVASLTEDMTPEQREQAGYGQLQYENKRLREAIVTLKEDTMDREHALKSTVHELQEEASQVEPLKQQISALEQEIANLTDINEHLRGQVDGNEELQEQCEELTSRVQDMEDAIVDKDTAIRDYEALKELTDELETQHQESEEDMRTELEARDIELTQRDQLIRDQNATITDQADLIMKLRDLASEFQGRAEHAEESRTMTETQAKDTTSRFNEVMDLNRRLRASHVQATNKEITSELRKLAAEEANEKLTIYQQTESKDFENSESLRSYFTSKSIASKAGLVSTLLSATDRQLNHTGGIDQSFSRVHCNQAVYHLELVKAGSNRLWSAMSVSSLEEFGSYGPIYQELLIIEKALDQGLKALKADEVDFDELSASLGRAVKIQDELISKQTDALVICKEDETLTQAQNLYSSLRCLDTNHTVVIMILRYIVVKTEVLSEGAELALERIEQSAAPCNKAMLQCQKLVKALEALKADSLRPVFSEDDRNLLITYQQQFSKAASEAPIWSQNALSAMKAMLESSEDSVKEKLDIKAVAGFTEDHTLVSTGRAADQLEEWIEFCSVLMNNVEFEHGPSPWAQKAMDTIEARKKQAQILSQLEQLKAERKATQTSLIESSQLIETKQLAIDHLESKYRDATKKIAEQKQLDDKLEQATLNAKQVTDQLLAQSKEMARLRELAAQNARSDVVSPTPDTSNASARLAPEELPLTQQNFPASTTRYVEALQTENQWLRQRGANDMYERTMRHIAPPVKEERHERFSSSSRSAEVKARRSPLALEPIEFGSILCPPSPDEQMYRMHLIEKMFEDSEDEVTELDLEDTEAFEGFSSIHLSFVGDARDAGLV